MNTIPDWFWQVIEKTKPNKEKLNQWLETAEKERIVQFYLAFASASEEIADYWDGIVYKDGQFSEDDMEDFCNWIVSQGKEFWLETTKENADLISISKIYLRTESGETTEYPDWSPQHLAGDFFYKTFNENIYDASNKMGDDFFDSGEKWLDE